MKEALALVLLLGLARASAAASSSSTASVKKLVRVPLKRGDPKEWAQRLVKWATT